MKNLIDPKTLAFFQQKPTPIADIVKFLDSRKDIRTSNFCRTIGIEPRVIYDYRTYQKQKMASKSKEVTPKAASKSYNRYSGEDKYRLIKEYFKADSQGRTELLRKYGIYQSDIARWEEKLLQGGLEALGKRKVRIDKKSPEQLKIEELEKELKEQEKTSAKLSTLLVLQKKTFEILNRND